MKNINWKTIFIATILSAIILIPSLIAAAAEDEGKLGTNIFKLALAKLFYILRFPTHTLLWPFLSEIGATVFFGGLIFNCLFYGLLSERIIYLFKHRKLNFKPKNNI